MLIQAKRLARQALDAIAGNGRTERARRYRQPQTWMRFMVCQYRQAKIGVTESFAALPDLTEFGRLVQTLPRLERQFTDR